MSSIFDFQISSFAFLSPCGFISNQTHSLAGCLARFLDGATGETGAGSREGMERALGRKGKWRVPTSSGSSPRGGASTARGSRRGTSCGDFAHARGGGISPQFLKLVQADPELPQDFEK